MTRRRSRRGEDRRRRLLLGLGKLLLVLGAFALTAYYSYEVGFRVTQGEVSALKDELQTAENTLKARLAEAAAGQSALDEERRQAEAFKSLYEQVKPSEDMQT